MSHGPTTCCRALTNPITNQKVCSCEGQASNSSMFIVSPSCDKLDVDECGKGTHNCNQNAVCNNLNGGLVGATSGFECVCPPGLIGDGVSECQLYAYLTRFVVVNPTADIQTFNPTLFKQFLITSATIPAGTFLDRISLDVQSMNPSSTPPAARRSMQEKVQMLRERRHPNQEVAPKFSASGRRHLLQSGSGVVVTVTIASLTVGDQNIMTSSVNTTLVEGYGFQTTVAPYSVVSSVENINDPTSTVAAGFQVTSVQYNDTDSRWMVTVKYTPGIPNVVTSMYLSKPGAAGPPYTVEALNSYYISQHPCLLSQSVCCMVDYRNIYATGGFASNITSSVGQCDAQVQSADTLSLGFDPLQSQSIIEHTLDAYPDSYVERLASNEVRLHIAQTDLSTGGIAKREPLPNGQQGYMLTLFVGMTYFTLLPTNALGVTASQVQIQLTVTNSLTFSFASSQDYSYLKYITMSLIQTKWVDDLVERHMQLVKVGFVLPAGMRQNMNTGLVPLNSIRFAVAQSLPSQLNASLWMNPCFSGDNTGLYDSANPLDYRNTYPMAQAQTCAARQNLCTNPTTSVLSSSLVNFYFPIGDNTITPEMLASYPAPYFIYVYFQLSVLDSQGRVVVSSLFAKAQLDALSMSKACESVSATLSLLSATKIDIGIGLVGTEEDWNSTMRIFKDVTQSGAAEGANVDTTNITVWGNNSGPARSIQSGLISVVVRGSSAIFSRASASQFYLDIEQLSVMHFMDPNRFQSVISLLKTSSAYSIISDPSTLRPQISFSPATLSQCTDSLSCNLRNSIYGGTLRQPANAHPLATGIGTTSVTGTRDWLLTNVLQATDAYSTELATNMTSLLRSRYSVDDRVTKAWFVNPANKWTVSSTGAQSRLLLSDKLILFAVIVLNDGSGKVLRRRLLALSSSPDEKGLVPVADLVSPPSIHNILHHKELEMSSRRHLLQQQQTSVISEEQISSLLQQMTEKPRTGIMPPVDFHVDVPYSIASMYGEEKSFYSFLDIKAVGIFQGTEWTQEQVNNEFMRRILANQKAVCPQCSGVYPAFKNMVDVSTKQSSRRLLQSTSTGTVYQGTVSILLVYGQPPAAGSSYAINFVDVNKAVVDPTLNPMWTGDASEIEALVNRLKAGQFAVTELTDPNGENKIVIDLVSSGIVAPNPPTSPPPATSPPPGVVVTEMDMTVFGIRDVTKIPKDGAFLKTSDAASSRNGSDPFAAIILLVASLMIFWG